MSALSVLYDAAGLIAANYDMGAIHSMTGYAALNTDTPAGNLALELRTVNSRYLETHFRLGDEFRPLEPRLRELLSSRLLRGKVECRVSLNQHVPATDDLRLDVAILESLKRLEGRVRESFPGAGRLTTGEVLRWPGVLGGQLTEEKIESVRQAGLALADRALADLVDSRRREGEKIAAMLGERIATMREKVTPVIPRLPMLIEAHREKLAQRLRDAVGEGTEERINQELALYAQRIDVDEELDRFQAHLTEAEHILAKGGAVGKRLDFLMQELNREANTLASKSVDLEVTRVAMELKLLIEQMREQVQNVE
jgi:uncharacterized protein (TIGR00255 family)